MQGPATFLQVENIRVPLIMAHGKNDVIVNPGESERMFQVSQPNFFQSSSVTNRVFAVKILFVKGLDLSISWVIKR